MENGDKEQLRNLLRVVSDNCADVKEIKDNHLTHLKDEVNDVKVSMAKLKTDVVWIKKWLWTIAAASIGGLITGLINLLFK